LEAGGSQNVGKRAESTLFLEKLVGIAKGDKGLEVAKRDGAPTATTIAADCAVM